MKLIAGHFYGATLRKRAVAGLGLSESEYSSNHRHKKHSHERATFCLVLQGSFTENYRQKSILCSPNTLLFYPPGEPHADYFHDRGGRCFIIEVEPRWLEKIHDNSAIFDCPNHFRADILVHLATKLYRETWLMDDVSPLVIEGAAFEMMAYLRRRSKELTQRQMPRWLREAKEFIHENFSETFRLTDVASVVGVHPTHLAGEFRRFYGCTIGEYVRQARVEFARREILNTETSLFIIAHAAGFSDQSHFCRTFKQFTGMTPVEYRKMYRLH